MTSVKKLLYSCLIFLGLFMAGSGVVHAQEPKLQNKPYIDHRRFHYGFMVGLHQENLRLENNGYIDPETGSQWLASNDRIDPSFTVGVLGELRLNKYFALRLLPTMHFGMKHITFRDQTTQKKVYQELKSTYISFPVDVKFSGKRCNNFRPYMLAGVNVMYDLTTKNDQYIKLKALNTMLELGFGCDFYLPFFKLIPELKFCLGMNDIMEKNRNDLQDKTKEVFTKSIDRASTNLIVLTLHFE